MTTSGEDNADFRPGSRDAGSRARGRSLRSLRAPVILEMILPPRRSFFAFCSIMIAAASFATLMAAGGTGAVSAQDAGTATPAGTLVVVPGVVQQGETTLAVGFHVVPLDLDVKIEYSGNFTREDETCNAAGTAGNTEAAVAPVWITLKACTIGDAHVRLVDAATGDVIDESSVKIIEPGATGQATTVSITGLDPAELVPGGSGEAFSVIVTGLDSNVDHELHAVVLNNLSAAFNRGCTRFRASTDIVAVPSFTQSYTVYGCVAPGNRIWSWVEDANDVPLANSGISNNPVNVKAPTVSFGSSSYSVNEESEVDIPIRLSHRSSHVIRVPIEVSPGTDGTVTFRNRSTSEEFTYAAGDDSDCDDETVNLRFGTLPSTVSRNGSPSTATITIRDDDADKSPNVTGSSSRSYPEGGTGSVATYRATDPCGGSVSWSLPNTSFETDRNDFRISSSGSLTFRRVPDYENPDDHNDDNVYRITVRARGSNGVTDDMNVTVTVTNLAPTITSGSTSTTHGECETGSVASYRASDPGGGSVSWSLPNTTFETDRNDFDISSSGVLTFDDGPDYEDPDDSNDDNVYKVTVRASDGSLSASRNVTVTVTNRAPTITSGPTSVSYGEGRTVSAGSYRASDPCGGSISWSLPNTSFESDRNDFDISSSGSLTFDDVPDYEDPVDSNDDNVYKVTVRASDGSLSDSRNVTVTVTNRAPTITSGPTSVSYAEGGTGSVATYRASDPGGGAITWSLPNTSFETDRGDFDISSSGALTFESSPDYDDPDDHNEDNVYRITVRASDGSLTASRNVTVTVTKPALTIVSPATSISYAEGGTGSVATYRVSDPDGVTWSLPDTTFETDRGDFSISTSGVLTFDDTPDYEDPDDSNDDNIYKITVRASDGNTSASTDVTITVTNQAPAFTSGPPSVSYAEGGTGSAATYVASDPGGGAVTWSLPNTSFETDRGDFDISSGGVLTFDEVPDHEDPDDSNDDNIYKITVRASDGRLTVSRNVTVMVTNVAPTITSGPTSVTYAENGTGSVATYSASDPGGGTITWSLPNTTFETDRGEFDISSGGIITFKSSPGPRGS